MNQNLLACYVFWVGMSDRAFLVTVSYLIILHIFIPVFLKVAQSSKLTSFVLSYVYQHSARPLYTVHGWYPILGLMGHEVCKPDVDK